MDSECVFTVYFYCMSSYVWVYVDGHIACAYALYVYVQCICYVLYTHLSVCTYSVYVL